MALRNIVTQEDDLLRKKSKDVKNFGERTNILLDDMWETMRNAGGVGLAAPQVGMLRRAIVIDITRDDEEDEGKPAEERREGGDGLRNGSGMTDSVHPANGVQSAAATEDAAIGFEPMSANSSGGSDPTLVSSSDASGSAPVSSSSDSGSTPAIPPTTSGPLPVNSPGGELYELINPEVISMEGESCEKEGCLSVPGVSGFVKRPKSMKVKAVDRDGNEVIVEGEGMLAKALSHEIDHLNGVLFTDIAEEIEDAESAGDEGRPA